MIERYQFAQRFTPMFSGVGNKAALLLVLAMGLAGCHRKTLRQVLPQGVLAPVDLETPDASDPAPEIATLPPPEFGLPSPAPPPPRPVARRRPAAPKEESRPPVQIASEVSPAALAIEKSLSTGGEAAPQSQQQARDLIVSIQKRIAALPPKTADSQKKQIRQVNNFLDQALKALKAGDAEGANNLATKAKLLMDDLEKK